jgi:hypothetical protein
MTLEENGWKSLPASAPDQGTCCKYNGSTSRSWFLNHAKGISAQYYGEFKLLELNNIWFTVNDFSDVEKLLMVLTAKPMTTKKACEYANRNIENEDDKLMPYRKTLSYKNRDRGDRPTAPGHPG